MAQLDTLKLLLDNPTVDDAVLQFYLDNARDIICERRNSNEVETKFLNIQLKIAIEGFNKIGVEGQIGHNENGISRSYEASDVSPSLLSLIIPMTKTPYSEVRVVNV